MIGGAANINIHTVDLDCCSDAREKRRAEGPKESIGVRQERQELRRRLKLIQC